MAEAGNTTTPRATFTKEERLCGRLRLKEVVSTGRTVHESPIKLVGKKMALPTMQPAQVAFAIPRRYMRNAVDRNKMRRRMREAWRLNKLPFLDRLRAADAQCAWLFIYQGREPITFAATTLKITRSLDRWMKEHG